MVYFEGVCPGALLLSGQWVSLMLARQCFCATELA